jgi:hypothetical protein
MYVCIKNFPFNRFLIPFPIMKIKKILFSVSLFVFIFSSCSIEKRVHSNGYHIDWNGKPSRLELKEITLTEKHKSFNHFELSGPDYQEKTKPISVLNAGVLKTVKNKPKTLKTTINDLIAFAKTAKIKTRGEIKPNTIEQEAKSPVDPEAKYDPYAIAGFICGITLFLWPLALVFGLRALDRIDKNPLLKGRGLAIAGMWIAPVFLAILLIFGIIILGLSS